MSKISNAVRLIKDPDFRFVYLSNKGFYNSMPDDEYLKRIFEIKMGYRLDLDNPKTFNEKLQWLKLYDRKPEYPLMVDKYEAKKYVADILGEEYIIPTLGLWDRFDDIDFDKLPNQFVLKCTHDSGGIVICKDKASFNVLEAKKTINACLKRNYYFQFREWPYKNVAPRIIAEKYMEDFEEKGLIDYKVHSFNGVPKVILICQDRFKDSGMTEDFYSTNWEHLDVKRETHPNGKIIDKPDELNEMLNLASRLSKNIPFVRTDFYTINHKIFFGELTFFPASGLGKFMPEEWDKKLGDWMILQEKDREN